MMYFNMIWMWGHPEVYVLILAPYGIFSEVVSTFSHKTLAGYKEQVIGLFLIALIALGVWLHHFYTMGSGANVNARRLGSQRSSSQFPPPFSSLTGLLPCFEGK